IAVTTENFDKVGAIRSDLDGRRAAAIKKYMTTQFGPPIAYEVSVHDAPVPSIYAPFAVAAFRSQGQGYSGAIGGSGGFVVPTAVGGAFGGGGYTSTSGGRSGSGMGGGFGGGGTGAGGTGAGGGTGGAPPGAP